MQSLAVKYRPQKFEDVCSQESIIKILQKQLETKTFKNAYLFSGASGCGKTTIARLFALELNQHQGVPIEIDGASNNGVDNVRNIISSASERSLDSKYKVFIIDEAQGLSNSAWQAFLKCIEEPPEYTVFIFCTTDPQKIPATILNRVMRFNFCRIGANIVKDRLGYICKAEGFTNYTETCDYIAKICNGGMRDAISLLEKVADYSRDLNINYALEALGNYSYNTMFSLVNAIIDGDEKTVISIVEQFYNMGNDLSLFINQFLTFCLDIDKFAIFGDADMTTIPSIYISELERCINFDGVTNYYSYLINKLLELKNSIKYDMNLKSTIEVGLLSIARCQ